MCLLHLHISLKDFFGIDFFGPFLVKVIYVITFWLLSLLCFSLRSITLSPTTEARHTQKGMNLDSLCGRHICVAPVLGCCVLWLSLLFINLTHYQSKRLSPFCTSEMSYFWLRGVKVILPNIFLFSDFYDLELVACVE